MEYDDHEKLQISEDRSPVSRGLQWCQQPVSSRPIFLLCCVCAGLIIVNIAITISSRGPRGNEEETKTSSQEGEFLMSVTKPRTLRLPPENETLDGACPDDWSQFRDSCYYVSNLAKSWKDAYKMCQRRKAKLTVINTQEEQVFLSKLAMKIRFWIGLSEFDGEWKWVDGTPFSSTPRKWSPGQPDDYYGHGLGGGEDCGMLYDDGNWNDEHCTRPYRYICEKASVVAQ